MGLGDIFTACWKAKITAVDKDEFGSNLIEPIVGVIPTNYDAVYKGECTTASGKPAQVVRIDLEYSAARCKGLMDVVRQIQWDIYAKGHGISIDANQAPSAELMGHISDFQEKIRKTIYEIPRITLHMPKRRDVNSAFSEEWTVSRAVMKVRAPTPKNAIVRITIRGVAEIKALDPKKIDQIINENTEDATQEASSNETVS